MNYSTDYDKSNEVAQNGKGNEVAGISNNIQDSKVDVAGLVPIPKKSRTIKTDKPRPFLCPICTRGFVRQEHLKRHQRSHTNEKPFLCVFCGRCFARRDLVLRHQHKLHASLVGKTPSGNISSSSSSNEISDNEALINANQSGEIDKHIIKIAGNKESILPTPSNPMAKTTAQLKKAAKQAAAIGASSNSLGRETSSSSSLNSMTSRLGVTPGESPLTAPTGQQMDTNPVRKRKRHASFSATNAFTYINENFKTDDMAKELEFARDIPHQVGFATPQLTAQELMEKLIEAGGIDIDALGLPPDFSLDDASQKENMDGLSQTTGENINVNSPDIQNNNYNSSSVPNNWTERYSSELRDNYNIPRNSSIPSFSNTPMTPSAYLLKSMPSITNFLTMGSTGGGTNGFTGTYSVDSNLTSFGYESLDSLDSHAKIMPDNTNKSKNGGLFVQPIQNDKIKNSDTPNPHSLIKNNSLTSTLEDDQWLSEFIYQSQLSPGFKVDLDNINDVGFADVVSNSSLSESSSKRPLLPTTQSIRNGSKKKKLQTDRISISPTTSNNISGSNSPFTNNRRNSLSLGPAITSFFTSRQKDLFDTGTSFNSLGSSPSPLTAPSEGTTPDLKDPSVGKRAVFFNDSLRNAIIKDSNLDPDLFPSSKELNNYVKLYQKEFHRYFSFIHLHTIVPSTSNYSLILSIAIIGALYGFHSTHAMYLSNICWLKIRNHLNTLNDHYENTPLWLIQSMVLLIFFGIFSNDLSVSKTINTKMKTLIKLVKLTKLNLPLESLQMPPIESDHVFEYQDNPEQLKKFSDQYNSPEQIVKDFKYFITAQSRIKTCHMILLISNLFTSLVGLECSFHSIDLKCGVPCFYEKLYSCEDAVEWGKGLSKYHIDLDSKFSLIQLSNGLEDYQHCLMYISTGSQYYFETSKVSFKTLLSMLISIHEKIYLERRNLNSAKSNQINEMKWRMNSRPAIESMLKYWEAIYIKTGGILTRNQDNIPIINENPSMRLIIVLHLFANIRKCVDLTDVINKIWLKQWTEMNLTLDKFCSDWDSLREATDFALNVIDFWADTVSIMKNVQGTAISTPIFSITCILYSILIVSEHMRHIEAWGQEFDLSSPMNHVINPYDRMLWLKSEQVLKKVEAHLLPKGYNTQSYSEFLRSQAGGALDVDILDNDLAQRALKPDFPIASTIDVIVKARLSSRSLYLGVRILGDAPIWPVALLFAHALQARAIYNVKNTSSK